MRQLNSVKLANVLFVTALFAAASFSSSPVSAVPYYWDINGATPGAGGATPAGTWSTGTANWSNNDPTGSTSTVVWNNTNTQATFAAGTDATGNYTVTASGTPVVTQVSGGHPGIQVNSGNLTLTGGPISLVNTNFGAGFDIASGASLTVLGTNTITRTGGTGNGHTYLFGAGTLYMPGFLAMQSNQTVVVHGGAWDFGSDTTFTRNLAIESTNAIPGVFQGSGTLTRNLNSGANGAYWSAGFAGGFAARGGQLDVTLTSPVTFGAANSPGNGSAFVLGSPTANSLVDFKSNLNLASAAQNIMAWNPNNNAGNIARISGVISSAVGGSLTKIGTGTLQLTNANTYSGGTNVNEGTLLLNNSTGSATGTGAIIVNANGILGGTGATTGTVNVNATGTLAPGSAGTESLSIASLTMQTGSTFAVEIGGNTAGAVVNGYDQLIVNGTVNLNNATLNVSMLNFNPVAGDGYFILANDGVDAITGTFAGLANDAGFTSPNGQKWRVRYNVDAATLNLLAGSGNDIALIAMPVPEPSMLALMGFGGAMIAAAQRRRRRVAVSVLAQVTDRA